MSVALLSIPLGIISIIVFIWAINGTGAKPAKGKKKDNDSAIIGIIVSLLLFFVSIGIFDSEESTGGMFKQDNSKQGSSLHESERYSSQSQVQRKTEGSNESAEKNGQSKNENQADSKADTKDEKSKVDSNQQNQNLEEQRKAYQKWQIQIESKVQTINTIWSALWTEGSPESIDKLTKALHKEQAELAEIKVPAELSTIYRQRLTEAMQHYNQWIDFYLKACQMKVNGSSNQDIISEVAKGDGLRLRANVEISNVGNELNIK